MDFLPAIPKNKKVFTRHRKDIVIIMKSIAGEIDMYFL
jgi:hypothetical protein